MNAPDPQTHSLRNLSRLPMVCLWAFLVGALIRAVMNAPYVVDPAFEAFFDPSVRQPLETLQAAGGIMQLLGGVGVFFGIAVWWGMLRKGVTAHIGGSFPGPFWVIVPVANLLIPPVSILRIVSAIARDHSGREHASGIWRQCRVRTVVWWSAFALGVVASVLASLTASDDATLSSLRLWAALVVFANVSYMVAALAAILALRSITKEFGAWSAARQGEVGSERVKEEQGPEH